MPFISPWVRLEWTGGARVITRWKGTPLYVPSGAARLTRHTVISPASGSVAMVRFPDFPRVQV
eukprot:COSAG06_NODE_2415_length_6914_cov_11.993544_3_plen_63_part_00